MIGCIGILSIPCISDSVGHLLKFSEPQEMENCVQIFNQLMVEFESNVFDLVDHFFSIVLNKLRSLMTNTGTSFIKLNNHQEIFEAPHVEQERYQLLRQYLMFVQHCATFGCHSVLFIKVENSMHLDDIFQVILHCIKGGIVSTNLEVQTWITLVFHNPSSSAHMIPLMKNSIAILTALTKSWLLSSEEVPMQLVAAFSTFLGHQALPTLLLSCTNKQIVNPKDAASQGVFVEVAGLLWTLSFPPPNQNNNIFPRDLLQNAVACLQWPPHVVDMFMEPLTINSNIPLGTYKEKFKMFIKTFC
jgi:hypothetical protein